MDLGAIEAPRFGPLPPVITEPAQRRSPVWDSKHQRPPQYYLRRLVHLLIECDFIVLDDQPTAYYLVLSALLEMNRYFPFQMKRASRGLSFRQSVLFPPFLFTFSARVISRFPRPLRRFGLFQTFDF